MQRDQAPIAPPPAAAAAAEGHRHLAARLRESFERQGCPGDELVVAAEASALAAGDATTLALVSIAQLWERSRRLGATAVLPLAERAIAAADAQPDVLLQGVARLLAVGAAPTDADFVRCLEATLARADQLEDPSFFARAMVVSAGTAYNIRDWPLMRRCCDAILLNTRNDDMRKFYVHNSACMARMLLAMGTAVEMRAEHDAERRHALADAVLGHVTQALATGRWLSNHPARCMRRIEGYDLMVQAFIVLGPTRRRRALSSLRRLRAQARLLPGQMALVATGGRGVCVAQAAIAFGHLRLARRALEAVRELCELDRHHDYLMRWRLLYLQTFSDAEAAPSLRREIGFLMAARLKHDMARAPIEASVREHRSGGERARATEFLAHDLRSPLSSALVALRQGHSQRDLERVAPEVEARLAATLGAVAEHESDSAAAQPLDLAVIVVDVMRHLQAPARHAGAQIVCLRLDPAWVLGVPSALWRALFNVIDNALRHGGPAGRVEVALHAGASHHCLTICDRGPGFALQSSGNTGRHTADGQVHGIGMESVRRIVRRLHFGRVRCGARSDGVGGRVELMLAAIAPPSS